MVITKEFLESVRSLKGGYSKSVVTRLGVAFPLKSGWRQRLIGQEIPDGLFIEDPINPGRWKPNHNFQHIPDVLLSKLEEQKKYMLIRVEEERRALLSDLTNTKRERRRRNREQREIKEISYIIGALGTQFIKIGKTTRTVGYRLSALQTSCPHKLVVLATTPMKEKKLHKKFWFCRTPSGEWFEWCNALGQFITECGKDANFGNLSQFRRQMPSVAAPMEETCDNPEIQKRRADMHSKTYSDSQLDVLKAAFQKKFKI